MWLAIPFPAALAGGEVAKDGWFGWLLSADVLIVWWAVPWLAERLLGGPLGRLDDLLDYYTIGAWANRAARYGVIARLLEWRLPSRGKEQRRVGGPLLLFVGGAGAALLLFNVGVGASLLMEDRPGPFAGLALLFLVSVVGIVGFESFFVPDAGRRLQMDLQLERRREANWHRKRALPTQERRKLHWLMGILLSQILIVALVIAATIFLSSYEAAEIREMLAS